ncbi:DEAD/DEAH box helicase [Leifsonia sp. Leaf336]|uniref:DEAD/DEAH box helicase n=1 Tax=Leifsonia sp. Leaf336 TaxID=1736341 RepID=UPI0006F5D417|nr:DEAD/DEAH box helicase [Leifsonia sp. Leaf336]KQR52551.1 DEAD/DEAH box helicase [Leifsonia sp. Leaf336]
MASLRVDDLPGWTGPGSVGEDAVYEAFVAWAEGTGITLYPAQDESLIEIAGGSNLILSTPTGTGKSLVAVGAHFAALARGDRSFYTAPIKALVSEKFFALVDVFGAENVGMMTGDSSVNADAAIICCTAEILANLALRQGEDTPVGQVVMDEFHFYSDPDRGWAWQVPLLLLSRAQFVLMSATLGDVTALAADLSRRTGRETATVTGVERPVPLHYYYELTPVHDTVEDLLHTGQAPIYIVHFSQLAALERAQSLSSAKIATREQRDAIADAIGGFRFTTSFGRTLSRLLRQGIGVHHAGMLPKYRRLVEQLAQRGMLRVICGTDTLGVGINVPIRTVLLTALTKFDGTRMRQLNAREFHQIAGRAGRAGYDTAGTVVVQAPEHESENAKALEKAGDDPKKRRKIVRKKAPEGFVSWGEPSFRKLVEAEPETLTSSMQITSAMLINVIGRGGDVFGHVRDLVFDNHEPWKRQLALARRALGLYRSLVTAGVVEVVDGEIRLTVDLQPNFALNQPLSPFALAAFELFDVESPTYALDIVSVVEATLDDPRPVLSAQQFQARGEAVAAMKAEGIEYDERMEALESVTHPKPHEELLNEAFATYASSQPWVADFELSPKAVVRDLYERAMTFGEFIAFYKLARSEGVVLRYLSDAYRALNQTVPLDLRTEELRDIVEWIGELVRQVDSSLLDEWEELVHPDAAKHAAETGELAPPAPRTVTANRRAFFVLVRNELFRRVQLAALDRVQELGVLENEAAALADATAASFTELQWDEALEAYYAEHDEILTDASARSAAMIVVDEGPAESEGLWRVRQIIADPAGDHDWGIAAEVLLADSARAGAAVIRVTGVDRL